MAEVVERNLEDSIGEILHIRKAKLFNKLEINEIVRKRRHHEYSLQKRNKRILDYDAYINTEITIMKLLRCRRQMTHDSRYVDKIEKSIISRLVRLHRQLCYRFQSHIDLWMRFIHFCKIINRHLSVVRIWNNVLRIHGRTEPRLWIAAAAYHLHDGVRSQARGDLRHFAEQKSDLIKTRKRLRSEYMILNRHTPKSEKQKINQLMEELKENQASLDEAAKEMVRERCLTWDRAHLNAIREARHLITEGISFNPECDLLHLELVKLEINALDFFRTRVLPRYKNCDTDLTNSTENEKKKVKTLKNEAEENKKFMSLITENTEFIVSGGAVNLVIESLLSRWVNNSKMLELLHQTLLTVPQLIDSQLIEKVANCVKIAKEEEEKKGNICESAKKDEAPLKSKTNEIRSTISNQLVEIHQTMMEKGVEAVIHLWNSWYLPSTGNSPPQTSPLRMINPSFPEAVGLLRSRLSALSLYSAYEVEGQSLPTSSTMVTNDEHDTQLHNDYHRKRQFLSAEVNKTRVLFDLLSTSQWGSHCPEFWLIYLQFEKTIGDITQMPAVQWRAQKTLSTECFDKFIVMLNKDCE